VFFEVFNMSKAIVIFTRNWRGYAADEVAGFDVATAEALIESGYAEPGKKTGRKGPKSAAAHSRVGKPAEAEAGSQTGQIGVDDQGDDEGKP
jgi:hypothetical protein